MMVLYEFCLQHPVGNIDWEYHDCANKNKAQQYGMTRAKELNYKLIEIKEVSNGTN